MSEGAHVGVNGEEVTYFFSGHFSLPTSTVIYALFPSFFKDEGGIYQWKKGNQ